MGIFRKSLEIKKKSKQIEENLKKLDRELKKTGVLDNAESVETVTEDNTTKKFDWRKEFFPGW
jgi:hydroxymethylpyrimidine/phosphomethylpyrimidine kinase